MVANPLSVYSALRQSGTETYMTASANTDSHHHAARSSEGSGTPAYEGPRSELTVRAVLVGMVVAVLVGCSYPYVVLKLGFGPTISVVSAFLAFIGLNLIALVTRRRTGRYEYNIVQTAGTAAGQSAFMCVVLAAFDLLRQTPSLNFHINPSPFQVFIWMSVAGCLGVLLAVPLRKHYIDEEKLTFPDGTAAGETLIILDSGGSEAKKRAYTLAGGGIFSALFTWFRDAVPQLIPGSLSFSPALSALRVGFELSPMSFGSGLIVGLRITLSMALGMVLAWMIAPDFVVSQGWVAKKEFTPVLQWVMWPATGILVAGGLTGLALKWRSIQRTFVDLAGGKLAQGSDFPMRWVGIGVGVLSVALIAIQYYSLGVAPWESAVAIIVSVVLMVVGIRVLGETNWAPISSMANMVQGVFAAISPGSIGVNMVASGMSGTVAGAGEHLMQDYKAGKIIGSNNRALTYMQLLATPVGALSISLAYPLLRDRYGIGGECFARNANYSAEACNGMMSPISVKWAGFAEILMGGKLPPYTMHALAIAVVLGVLITLFEDKHKQYLPSPTGVALGMLIPALAVLPMLLGGLVQFIWQKVSPKTEEAYNVPLASGLIVGEALLGLVIPVLMMLGIIGSGGGGH